MATLVSIKELRNMPAADLAREVQGQYAVVAKLRLGVKMKKEKDSAKYKREKKQLARMKTVLNEKNSDLNRLTAERMKRGFESGESGIGNMKKSESQVPNPQSRVSVRKSRFPKNNP